MATMQFELVSPERKLASVAASEVQLPGAEGDFTAMPDHSPTSTHHYQARQAVYTHHAVVECARKSVWQLRGCGRFGKCEHVHRRKW